MFIRRPSSQIGQCRPAERASLLHFRPTSLLLATPACAHSTNHLNSLIICYSLQITTKAHYTPQRQCHDSYHQSPSSLRGDSSCTLLEEQPSQQAPHHLVCLPRNKKNSNVCNELRLAHSVHLSQLSLPIPQSNHPPHLPRHELDLKSTNHQHQHEP